jgi:hypothetical protein
MKEISYFVESFRRFHNMYLLFQKGFNHNQDILKILIRMTMRKSIGCECNRRGAFV